MCCVTVLLRCSALSMSSVSDPFATVRKVDSLLKRAGGSVERALELHLAAAEFHASTSAAEGAGAAKVTHCITLSRFTLPVSDVATACSVPRSRTCRC